MIRQCADQLDQAGRGQLATSPPTRAAPPPRCHRGGTAPLPVEEAPTGSADIAVCAFDHVAALVDGWVEDQRAPAARAATGASSPLVGAFGDGDPDWILVVRPPPVTARVPARPPVPGSSHPVPPLGLRRHAGARTMAKSTLTVQSMRPAKSSWSCTWVRPTGHPERAARAEAARSAPRRMGQLMPSRHDHSIGPHPPDRPQRNTKIDRTRPSGEVAFLEHFFASADACRLR